MTDEAWVCVTPIETEDGEWRWRLCEVDSGELVRRWLPADELEPEPIDGGGWRSAEHADAKCFALGVLWWRALARCLGEMQPSDIDRERWRHMRSPGRAPTRARKQKRAC